MNTESESYEMRLWTALQELVHAIEKGAPEEVVWREIHDANKLLNEPFNEFTGLLLRTINAGIDLEVR